MNRLVLGLVIATGFALRMYLAAVYQGGYDMLQFQHSASVFARGGNIYVEQYYFNYSPLVGLPLAFLYHLPLPFAFTWRAFLSGVSLVNAVNAAGLSGRRGPLVFMLWWLNPAMILFDGHSGQFEGLALLPILLSLRYGKTFAGGALAVLIKHLTLPLTWTLFVYRAGLRRAMWWMVATAALFAAALALYLPDGLQRIIDRVFLYHSWDRYGFNSPLLFVIAIILLPFVARRLALDLPDALLFTALGQMTFIHGAGSNNFYPVFALALIRPSRWLVPLTVAAVLLINPFYPLEMNQPINTNNLLWLVVAPWFSWMLFSRYKSIRRNNRGYSNPDSSTHQPVYVRSTH